MSLFDSIRYSISDIPTEEELEGLPTELYNQWSTCWWATYNIPVMPSYKLYPEYVIHFSLKTFIFSEREKIVTDLRRRLHEYEPI